MKKNIYVLLTAAFFAVSPEVLNAEDNIQLSDEYFEINPGGNQNGAASDPADIKEADAGDADKTAIFSITPAPAWTIKRERQNELINEISFNENSHDGIISQEGIGAPENIFASGSASPIKLAKQNRDKQSGGPLPKTLKVSRQTRPKTPAPEIETILGDWVFDFPK